MHAASQRYARNKVLARFINTEPSATDQSQANDTDINVIVRKYAVTGTAPGTARQTMYEDFTQLPKNLRELIEQTRSVKELRKSLPEQLRALPMEELLMLGPDDLLKIHTPKETPKEEAK